MSNASIWWGGSRPPLEPMTALGDFRFVRLQPIGARQVAGFGAARSLDAAELRAAIGPAP